MHTHMISPNATDELSFSLCSIQSHKLISESTANSQQLISRSQWDTRPLVSCFHLSHTHPWAHKKLLFSVINTKLTLSLKHQTE